MLILKANSGISCDKAGSELRDDWEPNVCTRIESAGIFTAFPAMLNSPEFRFLITLQWSDIAYSYLGYERQKCDTRHGEINR